MRHDTIIHRQFSHLLTWHAFLLQLCLLDTLPTPPQSCDVNCIPFKFSYYIQIVLKVLPLPHIVTCIPPANFPIFLQLYSFVGRLAIWMAIQAPTLDSVRTLLIWGHSYYKAWMWMQPTFKWIDLVAFKLILSDWCSQLPQLSQSKLCCIRTLDHWIWLLGTKTLRLISLELNVWHTEWSQDCQTPTNEVEYTMQVEGQLFTMKWTKN